MKTKTYNRISIKNLKSCNGTDGVAYSCTVYFDGVKAAEAIQGGRGGQTDFHFTGTDVAYRLKEYIATLPPEQCPLDAEEWMKRLYPMTLDLEKIVAELCDELETEKHLRRLCRTKTVVRFAEDETTGQVTTFAARFTPELKQRLIAKYGDRIKEFVNETIA